jgi:hypothetical protein
MVSFQIQLALRTAATMLVASVLVVALPTKAESADCKPSASAAHLTHLETLIVRHNVREAMSLPSHVEHAESDGEINR